jgi:hypothetical protein
VPPKNRLSEMRPRLNYGIGFSQSSTTLAAAMTRPYGPIGPSAPNALRAEEAFQAKLSNPCGPMAPTAETRPVGPRTPPACSVLRTSNSRTFVGGRRRRARANSPYPSPAGSGTRDPRPIPRQASLPDLRQTTLRCPRRNAIRHGLTAEAVIEVLEDPRATRRSSDQ